MTLTTTARTVTFTGNGSTTEFAYTFKIPLASHLVVQTFDTVSLSLTTISSSNYTVTGLNDASGGVVTYPLSGSPLASTVRIIITRVVPFTQALDIQNQSGFFPEVFEDQLDLLVMQIQQNAETIARSIISPVGDTITDLTLPLDAARASKYLFFAADGSVGVTGTAPAVQYQGAFNDANEPTLRLGGTALVAGDLYFNTTSDVLKIYNGSSWVAPVIATAGKHTIWFGSGSGTVETSAGPEYVTVEQAADKFMVAGWAFDPSSAESLQISWQSPKSYNGGTFVLQYIWAHNTASTNFGVSWEAKAVTIGNNVDANATFGSAVNTSDTGGSTSGYKYYISAESSEITATNAAAEKLIVIKITRDVADGADTLAVDAVLIGVRIHYTTDANTDD